MFPFNVVVKIILESFFLLANCSLSCKRFTVHINALMLRLMCNNDFPNYGIIQDNK